MKRITMIIALVLMVSVPLTSFAKGISNEEVKKKHKKEDVITSEYEPISLYSGPIGGDEDLRKLPEPTPQGDNGMITPYVRVSDGAQFHWTYDETTYGTDKMVNQGYSWLTTIFLGGSGSLVTYWIAKLFIKQSAKAAVASGMASAIWSRGTSGLDKNQSTYWTVKKYVDKDAYNMYNKFVVYVYKDKAKKKLITSFTEVQANRYK